MQWISFEIEYLLIDIITRLPCHRFVKWLFVLRGFFNFIFDRDWRNLLVNKSIRRETSKTLRIPEYGKSSLVRFIAYSLEEFDILILRNEKNVIELQKLESKCSQDLINLTNSRKKSGAIMLSLHYGSFTLGILSLRSLGLPIYVLGSNVVNSSKLPPSIRSFFQKKYQTMNKFLNGGTVMFLEEQKKAFFKHLKNGAIGVALTDLIAGSSSSSLKLKIFENEANIQAGLAYFAKKNEIPIGFFLCRRTLGGNLLFDAIISLDFQKEVPEVIDDCLQKIIMTNRYPQDHWLIADSFSNLVDYHD